MTDSKLVEVIANGFLNYEITDFATFLDTVCNDICECRRGMNGQGQRDVHVATSEDNVEVLYFRIVQFANLIDIFVQHQYIKVLTNNHRLNIVFSPAVSNMLGTLLNYYYGIKNRHGTYEHYYMLGFIPNVHALRGFCDRGYRTLEEYSVEEERQERKREKSARKSAQNWTRWLAIGSLVIGAIGVWGNFYIYKKYSNERKVEITNQSDTIKVLLLQNKLPDVIESNDNPRTKSPR